MEKKKFSFNYVWVIVGLCFLMVCTSLGFCSSGRTLYLTAITDALNLKRGAFSLNDTVRFVISCIINLYFGKLVARFGTKKLICAGFVCLIAFALINCVATTLLGFYIGSIFLGVGLSWTSTSMASTVVNRWCTSNKGTITGAVLAANGLGGAVSVQILSPIIYQEGNPFGYRDSYKLVAVILAVMLALIVFLYKSHPSEKDPNAVLAPSKKKARGTGWIGMDPSVAVKKPYFYIAAVCIFFTGMGLQGIGGIAVPHMYDVGVSKEFVASITSISSILLMSTKFLTGFSYDRFGMRLTMNIGLTCSFLSLIGLVLITDTPVGRTIAFLRIIFASFALPLETIMLPLYASDFFGNKSFDKVLGIFVSANYAGYALGSPLGNLCYDISGNYNFAFVLFGALMLVVTVAMQYVLKAANKDKNEILANE